VRFFFILRIILVLTIGVPIVSEASDNKFNTDGLIELAKKLKLSQQPVWHKLIHYEEHALGKHQFVSAIHDEGFFNAIDGATNPAAELESTIRGLTQPPKMVGDDEHTQCKFPARFHWLRKSLNISPESIPFVNCPKFHDWTLQNSITSVSIVYASGFLGNPASYYGHILLKLNSKKVNRHARLFDPSINYGAIVPSGENPFTYIFKGIFGGYDGRFSQADYYYHNHNYGELELRNLWEYEVNLTQTEIDLVVAHAWEVLGKQYKYYFFRKNCAYRLAEMLEIIDGVNIIPKNPFFTLPRALLQNIAQSKVHGKPLVRNVTFRASREARFYDKFNALIKSEKSVVKGALDKIKPIGSSQYAALPSNSKTNVVEALIDYYQFSKTAKWLPEKEADENYHAMIKERFKLPVSSNKKLPSTNQPPHSGRKSSNIRVGFSSNNLLGDGLSLFLRPAYYDVLDATSGQVKNSALSMGELKLFFQSGNAYINYLNLLKIESINSSYSKPSVDIGPAWNIKLGIEQNDLSCLSCLVTRLEGDYGYTTNVNRDLLVGVYAGAGIQDNRQGNGNAFIRASVFSHVQVTNNLNMKLYFELPKQIDGSGGLSNSYTLEARQSLAVNTDLRFLYEKNKAKQYSVYIGYYF